MSDKRFIKGDKEWNDRIKGVLASLSKKAVGWSQLNNAQKEDISIVFSCEAAEKGNAPLVAEFLKLYGTPIVNEHWGWGTPLMRAARLGHTDTVELLLKNNANTAAKSYQAMTALMYATEEGRKNTVEMLLKNNADPNTQHEGRYNELGFTALMIAAKMGNKDIVMTLLENGADPKISTTENGWTAQIAAAENGHTEIAALLEKLDNKSWPEVKKQMLEDQLKQELDDITKTIMGGLTKPLRVPQPFKPPRL